MTPTSFTAACGASTGSSWESEGVGINSSLVAGVQSGRAPEELRPELGVAGRDQRGSVFEEVEGLFRRGHRKKARGCYNRS